MNGVLFQCILHKAKELDQKLCVIHRESNQSTLLVGQHIFTSFFPEHHVSISRPGSSEGNPSKTQNDPT